jgi:hypothetical protein
MSACFRRLLFLFYFVAAGKIFAQAPALPAQPDTTNSLMVEIQVWSLSVPRPGMPPAPARWSNDRKTFTAPCDIHIMANVVVTPRAHKGDTVMIDFFANAEKLGSRKSVWLPELNPSAHPHGNEPVPMFIRPAQFSMESLVCTNAPPGHYTLTAKAAFDKNPAVASAPVNITVLPSSSLETNGHP